MIVIMLEVVAFLNLNNVVPLCLLEEIILVVHDGFRLREGLEGVRVIVLFWGAFFTGFRGYTFAEYVYLKLYVNYVHL